MCIGNCCMLEASLLVLAFEIWQNRFVGMRGSLANGENYKTVRRNMDSETEEVFLDCMFGISSN